MITISLTAYLAFFANRRCRESGLSRVASQGKALEIAVLGLVAFLEIPAKGSAFEARTLLEIVFDFRSLPGRYLQTVVLFVGLSKIGVWLYLYSLVLRYHAYGNRSVFAESRNVSTRKCTVWSKTVCTRSSFPIPTSSGGVERGRVF